MQIIVRITPNEKGTPAGKLADAELHFIDGKLDGLKLIGFSVWERRVGMAAMSPSRRAKTPSIVRRSFALLRPVADQAAEDRVRHLVLSVYAEHEEGAAAGA